MKLTEVAEKLAKEICPHAFDKSQKDYIRDALIEFAKAIIELNKRKPKTKTNVRK